MSKIIKQTDKHKLSKKYKMILTLLFMILVVAIVGAVYWLYPKNEEIAIVSRNDDEINLIINETEQLNDDGDFNKSASELQTTIKETEDISQKVELLDNLAYVYYDNNEYDQALVAALEAESLNRDDKSDGTEAFIASIYEAKGDNQNAIKYYQEAIKLLDKSYPWYESRLADYQDSIKELGGSI